MNLTNQETAIRKPREVIDSPRSCMQLDHFCCKIKIAQLAECLQLKKKKKINHLVIIKKHLYKVKWF